MESYNYPYDYVGLRYNLKTDLYSYLSILGCERVDRSLSTSVMGCLNRLTDYFKNNQSVENNLLLICILHREKINSIVDYGHDSLLKANKTASDAVVAYLPIVG